MPSIHRSALVMHSVKDMYDLINDVLAYPQFLPDCNDSKIISQSEDSMTAALKVSKGGVSKWFTTENTLEANKHVTLNLVDGPFKQLSGRWDLTELSDEACKITLNLEYEFSSKLLEMAFGKIFNNIANNMVQAFTERAKKVYG
ncbi:MAG: type II toxin-antitoxin system RatA family toxin [Thalassotalea sp.]|nr:ubiquinone-binding protein [Colwelliaceae bacterium]MCH2056351.1 type II toxin-antitoxin system RatA family toxin [Thalassotalea sp.]